MWLLETLIHTVKGLFRKPHTIRKICAYLVSVLAFYILAYELSIHIACNYPLSLCLRWLWAPVSFLYLIALYGEVVKRFRFKMFFSSIDFWGYDEKLPKYLNSTVVNTYLKQIRFKSRIPIIEWKKVKPTMEMFLKREIFAIENRKEKLNITEVYLIQEDLPSFIAWSDEFMPDGRRFAIGVSYKGKEEWNAAALGHGLIAGSTGSGKTALLRCIIHQAILKRWNVQVLDFKGGGDYASVEREAFKYHDLEDGYGPFIITDPKEARDLLLALTIEVKRRLGCLKEAGVSNIDEYKREQFIPWLIVIDEAAEILDLRPKDKTEKELYADIDQYLRTLARMSRAAGVHILMGFIRPSSDLLDGQVKNNLLWRACGYFADPAAARIVLDNDRATELPPEIKGRFVVGEDEVQAYYLPVPQTVDENIGQVNSGRAGGEV